MNSSQPRPNYQGFSNGPRQPVPPPPKASNARSQPPPGYSELDKYERRIRSDMERMLTENNKRMLKLITKQFSQTAIANREKGTFPSQPETNPKGKISSGSTPDTFRKVNAIITLRSGKEIDNHVEDN